MIQSWIDWQYQNGNLTSSIQQYVSKFKKLLSNNGIRFHASDFDEPLEFMPKIKEELHELIVEEIQTILKYANPKKIGFYLALSCSGARPGELLQVRKKDIDITKKRIQIRIEAGNVKTRSGRSIWLTKEAGSHIIPRLKKLKDNDLVWCKNKNFSYAEKNESTQFANVCDQAGYSEKYKSNNFRKITLYSFRSYFFGRAADVHREGYTHRMIGQGRYLAQYDRMSDEKKLNWYMELEKTLIIDSTKRQQVEISKQKSEISELKKIKEDLGNVNSEKNRMATTIEKLESRLSVVEDSESLIQSLKNNVLSGFANNKEFERLIKQTVEQIKSETQLSKL